MRWFILAAIYLIVDLYAYQALRVFTKNIWVAVIYFVISAIVIGNLFYQFNQSAPNDGFGGGRGYAIGIFLAFFVGKIVLSLVMLGEDVVRIPLAGIQKLFAPSESFDIPSRRKFISTIALGLAAIPFAGLLYGMYKGRYNFRVLRYILYFEDLPDAFDGYTISQISDVHSGSFDNKEKIQYGVDLLKEQGSDLVVFTGDLVNNKASEMDSWKELFSEVNAPDGVYSILGNHDYGDYHNWESQAAKEQNLAQLKQTHADMGWNLMLNENRYIEKNGDRIALVGVENWGAGGFKKAGDLEKAGEGVDENDFKILLSHDPSHWEQEVKMHPKKYHLTMSGHTHGMQFGIEIPGWLKWSPVQYRYKHWAGIYEEAGRYINVNRGFGFLAYPGRIGIWPEISVIELKKGSKPA
ncbi:metallophosphoesterase [Christiangramia sabulilitoris]|uniref:Metallophosphoesterase n=1 Tax=Christiangramia sabulilitoris TaxID=2583991 RepID=A0A550HZX9_9FLAO|nr:metallophosphoesterase [Christiangramia sabulilitoris]TRO64286.1 metallophosphoesterase [Christiangramia sabulilitoris]